MGDFVSYLPIGTTLVSAVFAFIVFRRWRRKPDALHLLWWTAGVALFGVGTFFEGWTSTVGWTEPVFRGWYISGALLGGAPLAVGTIYLLMARRTAHIIAASLVCYVAFASIFVILTPLDHSRVEEHGLTGAVIEWTWVRAFSPVVNTGALIALVGGAIASAAMFRRDGAARRVQANVLIAVGAILPGIGGSFTRAGYTEVLYVTELFGVLLFFAGFHLSTTGRAQEAPGDEIGRIQPAVAGHTG